MKKALCFIFIIIISQLACSAKADSTRYVVKFVAGYIPPVCEYNLEKIYDNTYYAEDVNNLTDLEDYIEYIEPDETVQLIESIEPARNLRGSGSKSNSNVVAKAWQLEMVKADYAWDMATYGNGINVAVIDSGCNKHIDLGDNLAGGWNFYSNPESDDYSDNNGHGTHVAGIIAALHNDFGIMGVAPKVNIYALKCFEGNDSTLSIVAKAIRTAVDDYNCKIINLSLASKKDSEILYDAVQYASGKGAIIIAAVGNYGNGQICYPAGYEEVIGVGSVGKSKKKSYFSQFNSSVFVTAPGEAFESLSGESDYMTLQGTSQATPLVTAAAAILLSADNSMSLQKFKELIMSCSEDLGDAGYDTYYGYGLLDIQSMFEAIIEDYYVSPINDDGIIIYNNTHDELSATGILGEYAENEYLGGHITEIFVPSKEKFNILVWKTENDLKFFLWDSFITMRPLTTMRKTVHKTEIESGS
ncbi:MAG: S8 family serine peptidase [Clostridia bacterium]|nr:S8 family serine peptidase [Clostridia bacterium]